MTRRMLTSGLLATLLAVLVLAVAPAASAAGGTYLRLAHLSPDTPRMDVLVTSFGGETVRLDGVGYGDVSNYRPIEPGTYTVQMRLAGAADSSPPVVTGSLEAQSGKAYTAAGLGLRAGLAVNVLSDDLTPPAAGQARIRVVQGTEAAGAVSIRWNGAPMVGDVPFGSATDYVSVPAGAGSFEVAPAAGSPVQVPVRLDGGGVYSVIVVQRAGALAADLQTDAVAPGAVPAGGIETGLGGAAGRFAPSAVPAVLVGAVAVLGLFGLSRIGAARPVRVGARHRR